MAADKKLAAQWKRQLKLLKARDADKKREGLRLTAASARFFREQPEALPALLALLTRLKTPEIVLEALATLEVLLITPAHGTETEAHAHTDEFSGERELIHVPVSPDETPANRRFFILSTLQEVEGGGKTAGQPFVALIASAATSVEIKAKAIRIFSALLRECGAVEAEEDRTALDSTALTSYQTSGSPLPVILTCLTSNDPLLDFEALSCLALLLANDQADRLLEQFAEHGGVPRVLTFAQHPERRFHSLVLEITDTLSRKGCGRSMLKEHGALEALELMVKEANETITSAAAAIMSNGPTASNLTAEDVAIILANIPNICEIFTRIQFGKQPDGSSSAPGALASITFIPPCAGVIEIAMLVLQKDITNALEAPPTGNGAPIASGNSAAAAAAVAAAANAAAAVALFPYNPSRVKAMMSSLGRMIERDDQCRELAYSKHVTRLALEALRIPGDAALHQVADKLLHQSCVGESLSTNSKLGKVASKCKPIFKALPTENDGSEPVVSVKAVVTLLERAHGAGDEMMVLRICRWLAFVVEVPANAQALGDQCVPVLLKIVKDYELTKTLLIGFVLKCLCTIFEASPTALAACAIDGLDPVERVVSFLARPIGASDEENQGSVGLSDRRGMESLFLEWTDEFENESVFDPLPLTDVRHDIEPDLLGSQLLLSTMQGFEINNGQDWSTIDFWESFVEQESGAGSQIGKPAPSIGAGSAAPSKKRLDSTKPSLIGESTVSALFSSGHLIYQMIPRYAGSSPVVCVNLLYLIAKLLECRGGSKLLLNAMEKSQRRSERTQDNPDEGVVSNQSNAGDDTSHDDTVPPTPASPHLALLNPIMSVLHSNATCFDEVKAAIRVMWILTGGAGLHMDTERYDTYTTEVDMIINAAASCGAVVVLIAYLDGVRIPKTPLRKETGDDRLSEFAREVEALIMRFVRWGLQQQSAAEQSQQDIKDVASPVNSYEEGNTPTLSKLWATSLLDLQFDVPRFGYSNYSALLMATETGQNTIAMELLNVGASPDTSSSTGTTPLMLALLNREATLVHALLSHGADINAITTNDKAQTVWKYALSSAQEANKLISDTYIAAASCSEEMVIDATQLLLALDFITGFPVQLEECLHLGVDVNVSDADGNFLLHSIVSKSRIRQTIRGIDLCFRYDSRQIEQARLLELTELLVTAYKSDLNSVNQLGQSALHLALLYGHTEVARLLLHSGANPNVRDVRGYLPIHYACLGFSEGSSDRINGSIGIITLLLEAAAQYPMVEGTHFDHRKHKTSEEKQAIDVDGILRRGFLSLTQPTGIVTRLSNQQEILNTVSFEAGFLPWHMACGAHVHSPLTFPLDDTMEANFRSNGFARVAILNYFVKEWNIDLGKTAFKNVNALHLSIKSGSSGCNDEVINFLLSSCMQPESSSSININAVHEVAVIDSLSLLVPASEVLVSGLDRSGVHGFISSRSDANPNQYNVLLSNGGHLEAVERHYLKLSDSTSGFKGLRKYHLYFESAFSVLHYALQYSNELSLRLLSFADICIEPEGSDIPLLALACAAHRSADVVKRLIGPSANVRVTLPLISSGLHYLSSTNRGGMRRKHTAPLHYAVTYEDIDVTRELVTSSHVNVNVRRSGDGFTPLHIACELGNLVIIKLLIEHGADLGQEASSSAGDSVTPLRLLIKNDTVSSNAFRTLISENHVSARHLFGHFAENMSLGEQNIPQSDISEDEDYRGTCLLLDLEAQNLSLYDRIHELRSGGLSERESMVGKLESDLAKSDDVLAVAFGLIQNCTSVSKYADSVQKTDVLEIFSHLPHPHECFRVFNSRFAFTTTTMNAVPPGPQFARADGNEYGTGAEREIPTIAYDPNQLPQLLPPVRERQQNNIKVKVRRKGARGVTCIRYAPPPVEYPEAKHLARTYRISQADSKENTQPSLTDFQQRTAQSFNVLRLLYQHVVSPTIRPQLAEIYKTLSSAAYAQVVSDASSEVFGEPPVGQEFFTLLNAAERRLATIESDIEREQNKLKMERALQEDLVQELNNLGADLELVREKHRNIAEEVESEQAAVAHLEHEYAMLLDQESDMKRECGMLKGQLEKQQSLLRELKEHSIYLDYISHEPMKRHMEERKQQEQTDALVAAAEAAENANIKLEQELERLEKQAESLEVQYELDLARQEAKRKELEDARELRQAVETSYNRARECHTPRPYWADIIDRTPELSVQKYEWEMVDDTDKGLELAASSSIDLQSLDMQSGRTSETSSAGQTKVLVKEMLMWIERLQKHCGVNLHLSRIWHDVEEARVELNILHHQLDRVRRKTGRRAIAGDPGSEAQLVTKAKQAYIVALGVHAEIPMYLRHQGKVKQRTLKKSEVESLVRKVWSEKRKREMRNPLASVPLEDVLFDKLQRKYGFQPLIAEWGYNLLLALQTYTWDTEIELFLLVLTHAVSDRVYVDQEEMLCSCQALLLKLTECYGIESFVSERRVLLKDALVVLRKFFPLKNSTQLQAIEKSIIRDMHKMKRGGNDSILYVEDILPLGSRHPRGFFVKTIRTQHFKEIQDFYLLLLSELEERDANQTGNLTLSAIQEAIQSVDPLSSPSAIGNALARGLGLISRSQLVMHDIVEYRPLLKKMNTTGLMKFTLNFDPNADINWRRRRPAEVAHSLSTSVAQLVGTTST